MAYYAASIELILIFMKTNRLLTLLTTSILFSGGVASAGMMGTEFYLNPYQWTGWHVGANFGAAWGDVQNTLSIVNAPSPANLFNPPSIPGVNASGSNTLDFARFTPGFQVGYDKQFSNSLVVGLELSYNYINLIQSKGGTFQYTTSNNEYSLITDASTKQLITLRPRIGYAVKKFLPYLTGGGAETTLLKFNQVFSDTSAQQSLSIQSRNTKFGWAAGGGLEYSLFDFMSIRAEYLYTSFNGFNVNTDFQGTQALAGKSAMMNNALSNLNIQTMLFGINAHFS